MKRVLRTRTHAAALALLLLVGCDSNQKTGSLDQALVEYNAQNYTAAHEQAMAAIKQAKGADRDQAEYIAGLSAYRLGRVEEAERHLLTAANSADPQIAGKCKAMLGTIRMDQRRPRDAAVLFTEASRLLTGEDAKQAALHASMAHEYAGDAASAKQLKDNAQRQVAEANGSGGVGGAGGSGGFALQVGAFGEKSRAKKAARAANELSTEHGYGPARLITSTDSRGKPLYVVQFGRFATRDQAAAARTKLGKLEYIVATAPPARSASR